MKKIEEVKEKERRVREFLDKKGKEGLLLTYQRNFSWFTAGGENRVNTAATEGASSLLITRKNKYLIANNIETPRLMEEEVGSLNLEILQFPWNEEEKKEKFISKVCPLNKLLSDDGFVRTEMIDISPLQYSLTEREVERYLLLGKESSEITSQVCRKIEKGETENEVAGSLSKEFLRKGIVPTVVLIAADDRIGKFRHPLYKGKRIERCVLIVLCVKRNGLIVALSRLVHFGELPEELKRKHEAVVKVDASLILNSKIGKPIGEIFDAGVRAYRDSGFPEEWRFHHQGGPMGYNERYFVSTSKEIRRVEVNEPFGWNPSIRGTKSEDTIISTQNGIKIVTEDKTWPLLSVEYKGQTILRPDILIK